MKWFKSKNPHEVKQNPTGQLIFLQNRFPQKTRNIKSYITDGYKRNVIVYRCIREITTAICSVDIDIRENDKVKDGHEALKLLARPNPTESWTQFLKRAVSDYLVTGNMFIAKFPEKGQARELWVQSPEYMEVKPGPKGVPLAYVFKTSNGEQVFPVNHVTGKSQIFHLKTYNPENPFVGMSPLEPAGLSGDIHNDGLRWNSSLLQNGARPSGALKMEGSPGTEAVSRLRQFFKKSLQGPNNAGEIPILTDGAEWVEMDRSPTDMDYLNTMREMAKYIAQAFGVPLPLIDNEKSSFNNMEQAKEQLWTDTVLPLLDEFLDNLGGWLLPDFGENLVFGYDSDSIPALEKVRQTRFDRVVKAVEIGLMTRDEGRESINYKPFGGKAEVLLIPSGIVPIEQAGEKQSDNEVAKSLLAKGFTPDEVFEATGIDCGR